MLIRISIIILVVFISEAKAQKYPYTMQADISLLAGKHVLPVPGAQIFNGVQVKKWSAETGITVGADVYQQFTLLPVSASLKWIPLPQKIIMPYLSFTVGYGLAWLNKGTEEKRYRGGVVLNPSIGLKIKTKTKTRLNISAGFKQQKAAIIEKRFDDLGRTVSVITEKYKLGRVSLNFGVGF